MRPYIEPECVFQALTGCFKLRGHKRAKSSSFYPPLGKRREINATCLTRFVEDIFGSEVLIISIPRA